ncbi:MAG: acyltransferase family protein [Bradymonadia bacterium]
MRTPARLPALDGIRALSLAMVIVAHLLNTRGLEVAPEVYFHANLGRLGVQVFMVLSGFLITTMLLQAYDRHGAIDLKRFYLRRAFRIFPAYYTFVALMAVGASLGWVQVNDSDLLSASLFMSGYDVERAWSTGHLWSITVEEQFYLLWPWVLARWGVAGSTRVLVAVLVLAPVLRVSLWLLTPIDQRLIQEGFPTVMDALALGCLLAMYRQHIPRLRLFGRLQRWSWMPVVWLLLAVWTSYTWYMHTHFYAVGNTLLNVFIALFIDGAMRHRGGLGPLLNARPVMWVGALSYSIYLWQQPFIDRTASGTLNMFPWSVLLTLICGWLSYRLVEAPALRLRDRVVARLGKGGDEAVSAR